jgi:hypothetical protein
MKWLHRTIIKVMFEKKTWLGAMIELEDWFAVYTRKLRHRPMELLYLYGHPDD